MLEWPVKRCSCVDVGMEKKLPPAQWEPSVRSDDRAVIWLFVVAFAGICLIEMFVGH